jgi:[ribosomal protein S5]-alanine N-acetyltransferase
MRLHSRLHSTDHDSMPGKGGSCIGLTAPLQVFTPRLLLTDLTEDDLLLIHSLANEPAVTRYQSSLRLDTEASIQHWLRNAIHHNRQAPRYAYNLAITELSKNFQIGWIGWGRSADSTYGEYSFGYALLPDHWGQGYMTEALQAGLTFMFDELGVVGVTDYCEATNTGSMRVMQKAGLTEVARWSEEGIDYIRWAITRDEWLNQQSADKS